MLFLGNGGDSLFRGTNTLMGIEQISKRRSFFETSDMLCDEDYYDDQLPDKKRRLTPEQVQLLEKSFETENKLEPETKAQLAKKLGLQPRQVAIWFQNRRARWKTKQLERDYDLLKSSYDTLLLNFDSIKKQNQQLKLEIASLYKDKELQSNDMSAGATAAVKPDALQVGIKAEDRLSSGSGGSAVDDDDDDDDDDDGYGPHVLDSGNSYFPVDEYSHSVAAPAVQWEHDSTSYFPEAFPTTSDQECVPQGQGWLSWP